MMDINITIMLTTLDTQLSTPLKFSKKAVVMVMPMVLLFPMFDKPVAVNLKLRLPACGISWRRQGELPSISVGLRVIVLSKHTKIFTMIQCRGCIP